MATHQAIGAVAEAVSRLLAQSWQPSLIPGITPEFEVFHGKDFASPMAAGVSVFVYQVGVDDVQRTLPPAEPNHKRPLPVRIWLLLTAWAQDASTEHALLGWAMRAVADHPVLTSGFLNAATGGVFRNEETVELTPVALTNDEVFQLWQSLPGDLQLSMPYLAPVDTGLCGLTCCRGLVGVSHLEGDGADLSDRGVPAAPGVAAVLDPGPDCQLASGPGGQTRR